MPTDSVQPIPPPDLYQIVLPCDLPHFQDFVAGLLGKPQTITRRFYGPFDLTKNDISDFYHLVMQRMNQQNESSLIQFSVRVSYDNNSSVLLNSFSDFERYNEVRPIASIGALLSWTFLVKFVDREVPEKQQIEVSIKCQDSAYLDLDEGLPFVRSRVGSIAVRIQHTARTWGSDIEALLSGHILNIIHESNWFRKFVLKFHSKISLTFAILLFLSSIYGSFVASDRFLLTQKESVKALAALSSSDPTATIKKVDYIINSMASGMWPRFFYCVFFFVLGALILSVILGITIDDLGGKWPPSFLTLSRQAELRKNRLLSKDKRTFFTLIGSLVVGTATGVLGNIIFANYFQNWHP